MHTLILGCGYLGGRVARLWRAAGHRVTVVTRRASRSGELAAAGYEPLVADVTQPESLDSLPAADVVLMAVGYDRASGRTQREVYVDGLRAVLDHLPDATGRIVYISSTGVYGQTDGSWVDEQSPTVPDYEGGRACLAAEALLREHPLGARSVVLRLAGIYGPGRVPRDRDVREGLPLAAAADGWVNLIHVDDAARVVVAAAERATLPSRLVVADGCPVRRRDFYAYWARLAGLPAPRFVDSPDLPASESTGTQRIEPSPPSAADGANRPAAHGRGGRSDKRVRAARVWSALELAPEFPSYREGLADVAARVVGNGGDS